MWLAPSWDGRMEAFLDLAMIASSPTTTLPMRRSSSAHANPILALTRLLSHSVSIRALLYTVRHTHYYNRLLEAETEK